MRRAFISLLLLGFGVLLTYWGSTQLRLAYQTHAWPATPGTILKANVIEQIQTNNDQPFTEYYPDITYQYTVGDKTYEASRVQAGPQRTIGSDGADKLRYRYPKGTDVTVYYNPQNPQQAVLERTSYTEGALSLAAGVFLGIGGLIGAVRAIRARLQRQVRTNMDQIDVLSGPR